MEKWLKLLEEALNSELSEEHQKEFEKSLKSAHKNSKEAIAQLNKYRKINRKTLTDPFTI